jgi:hypothetical protein
MLNSHICLIPYDQLMEASMLKDYGIAQYYQAARLLDTAVLIVAAGQAPNLNTRVTLEQLPWRIFPPLFGLFFETPEVSLPATRPFVVTGVFPYPKGIDKLTVIDAAGRHDIAILGAFPFEPLEKEVAARQDFVAYRQTGGTNCMIAPADAMVPMIYSRAFGPAPHDECQAWVDKNCGKM